MKQDNAESASNLLQDYEDMLKDLSLLQKKDRRLRKKMLSQIPVSIQTEFIYSLNLLFVCVCLYMVSDFFV